VNHPSASAGHPLFEVEDLRVGFRAHAEPVVKGVSFALRRGECVAIVGESGSGKTVTSRALIGLAGQHARIGARRLRFDGDDVRGFDQRAWQRIRGKRIGFVMQDALGSLDPLRRVEHEIAEPLRLHTTLGRAARREKVIELLRAVGVPEPELRASQYPHELSGGLRQRALIASAIACQPELLIADEPTTALDAVVQAQILDLLETLRRADTGMLIVSHDFGVVSRLADRILVMQHGHIVEQGPADAILRDPQHGYTRALLGAVSAVHAKGRARARRSGAAQAATRQATAPQPATPQPATPHADTAAGPIVYPLEASGLSKSFTGPDAIRRHAVLDVSFVLGRGETLGIVGGSGSGKTTTMRMVLGLEAPDSGTVQVHGEAWHALSPRAVNARRKRIQIVFQDPLRSFDPRYTVERVIGEALGVAGYPPGGERRARTIELLELVSLNASFLTRRPIDLSGGQRQRVAIARALAPQPDILICDEPVSALDVVVQAQILALLDDLKRRLGLSCLFISHDLGVIRMVCDRVLVMHDGVVVEAGDVDDVFERPQHPYTRVLLDAIPAFTFERSAVSA
jgi:peptide/nickel transport system ATP-binding protein